MPYYLISKAQKEALSHLLARRKEGHGQFGRVLMRRPYREDEDEGGSGLPSPFEEHPLLGGQPVGASSDLTAIISARNQEEVLESAENRGPELSLDLQNKPQMQAALNRTHVASPKPG